MRRLDERRVCVGYYLLLVLTRRRRLAYAHLHDEILIWGLRIRRDPADFIVDNTPSYQGRQLLTKNSLEGLDFRS
jgi:hypothetical protein